MILFWKALFYWRGGQIHSRRSPHRKRQWKDLNQRRRNVLLTFLWSSGFHSFSFPTPLSKMSPRSFVLLLQRSHVPLGCSFALYFATVGRLFCLLEIRIWPKWKKQIQMYHTAYSKHKQVGSSRATELWKLCFLFPSSVNCSHIELQSLLWMVGEHGGIFPPRDEKKGARQAIPWAWSSTGLLFFPGALQDPHWLSVFLNGDCPWQP